MTPTAHLLAALATAADGPTDADLLARFATDRDHGAFELLVWRHAALVLRVCRAVLRNRHAAEDASQATFLALARQAGSVRGGNVAGWLFRVARRVAARALHQLRECPSATSLDLDQFPATAPTEPDPDLERVLHEELARLPRKYHDPVLLCFFEGLTHAEAACRLGWPVGTVAGRLFRARALLGTRLARRGIAPAALVVTSTAVSPSFAITTARYAVTFASKSGTGIPETVLGLVKPEVRAMFVSRALRIGGMMAACAIAAVGLVFAAEPPPAPEPRPSTRTPAPKAPKPPAAVVGKTYAIAPVTTDLQRRRLAFGGHMSAAVVFVDGAGLLPEPKALDLDGLDFKGMREALKAFGPGADRRLHYFTNYHQNKEYHPNGMELLRLGLEGMGRAAGFGHVSAMERHGFDDWEDLVAPLKDDKGAEAAEAGVGDDRAKAYPVRTPLSRVLTGGAGAVLDVKVPLDPRAEDWVPADVEKSVSAAIAALKLPKGERLDFYFTLPKRDDKTQDKVRKLVAKWAEENGVKQGSVLY